MVGTANSKYQLTLRKLINERQFSSLGFDDALQFFCRTVADVLDVDRVSIWEFTSDQSALHAVLQWIASKQVTSSGDIFTRTQAEHYFECVTSDLQLVINDTMSDPRCHELAASYFPKLGITSMLDCQIHNIEAMIGILCIEHTGPRRDWTTEEQDFAVSIASLISFVFESHSRAKAEKQVTLQTKRLEFYASLASDWQWTTGPEHFVTDVVGSATSGAPKPAEIIGEQIWEIPTLVPQDRSRDEVANIFLKQQDVTNLVFATSHPCGDKSFWELTGRPIYDEDGLFSGYWGVAKNITERLKAEIELRSSEQKYRNAARLAKVGSWVWDEIDGRMTYCSPELADIYAVTPDELIRRTTAHKLPDDTILREKEAAYVKDLSWIHPDDRDAYRKVITDAHEDETGYEIVTRIIRDDGTVRTLHELCEPVFSKDGQFIATTGVLVDITEQEERKDELRRSREQLANLMDNIPGALYRVKNDTHWTPVYTSAGFDRLFGFDSSKSKDGESPYVRVLKERDLKMIEEAVSTAIAEGTSYEFEYPVMRSKDEPPIWLFERGRPVLSATGEVELEGILIEVTEKHAAEEALIQSQRLDAVGQLTGGVAHDFNNLLAVILGNLEILKDEMEDGQPSEFVQSAIAATLRGADLTKNMLSFARQARLAPTVFNLNDAITGVQNWISRTLPENIEIGTKLAPDLWKIEVDAGSTESLILNLLLNARDAMPQGGRLTIETTNKVIGADLLEAPNETLQQGQYVLLSVTDTGHGIPDEILDRIFEPFFTTKPVGTGSGLGLSMIQGFIKQSGGTVHVYSEENIGTTFNIYFRAATKQDALTAPEDVTIRALPFQGVRVLLAEDETEVAKIIAKTLEKQGCLVTSAMNGDEALSIFQTNPHFDLLLTDIVMPGSLMGTHLAQSIRNIRDDLPVIFMSGYANEALVRGNGVHPDDIRLSKPISRADLLKAVDEALHRQSSGKLLH
ncbi:PAS domain S-box protein [Loktanella sp. S4079]|uniref:PAS domain S-box protein n=1 Tax=Loktanella sp. S4079 TaxID=579483 RepID=UPI0006977B30|nr:PAS domain S-box protein [Loktanella sp. S4079]